MPNSESTFKDKSSAEKNRQTIDIEYGPNYQSLNGRNQPDILKTRTDFYTNHEKNPSTSSDLNFVDTNRESQLSGAQEKSDSQQRKQRPGFQSGNRYYRNSRGYKYGSKPSPANFMMFGGPPAGFDQYLGMTKQSLNRRGSDSNGGDAAEEKFTRNDIDHIIQNYNAWESLTTKP